jgi:hypothetical protein
VRFHPGVISVVIPTLNAGARLEATLASLVPGVVDGLVREAIVADGGSSDQTLAIAEAAGAHVVRTEQGRGRQLRAGCAAARGEHLLVLHADTLLEPGWIDAVRRHLDRSPSMAGYFRLRFDERSTPARLWEVGVGLRCRLMALPYGDQGLLIPRALYDAVGGYPDWPLMEDVELVRRIGSGRLRPLAADAVTSAEKYRRDGWLRRSLANGLTFARWRLGVAPERLARGYD